jgi:putative cardiolipin synthase
VQRTDSFAYGDTAETNLGSEIHPLLSKHPDQSGFHAMKEGIDAFAARVLLVGKAQKSIDL